MQSLNRFCRTARFPFALALVISLGLVAGGVSLQELLRLAACPLCILQRMLYLCVAGAAALGLIAGTKRLWHRAAALLLAASAATGVFVAGYQTYLQRFAHDTQCSGAMAWWEVLVDWAGERVPLLFHASGLCSDPAWKFIGLSIAEWSLLAFCVLTLAALYSLVRRD